MTRFVCVANQKGGVGKTGFAGFIARSLGNAEEATSTMPPVLLVDRDTSCDASLLCGVLSSDCTGDERLKALAACCAGGTGEVPWRRTPFPGVGVLPGKLRPIPETGQLSEGAQFTRAEDLIGELRRTLPEGLHLIFDLPARSDPSDMMLAFMSDVLVIPVNLETASLRGMLMVLANLVRCSRHLDARGVRATFPKVYLQPWGKSESKEQEWHLAQMLDRIGEKHGFSVLPLFPMIPEFTEGVFSEGEMLPKVKKYRKTLERAAETYISICKGG